ncbi:hypothetical protein [Clostridium cadaveris]|uniref:phage major capsid protein n=1 Tax=Clostridium cadaveris TaxID=1529 RepID=UPI0039951F15
MSNTNIIIPEIYSQLLTEKVKGIVRIANMAQDLGGLDNFAEEGDSVTFPMFKALSDAELLARGGAISTEELKQTSTKKEVKHYAKGVSILDIDALEGRGDFMQNAIEQQARIFAKARDKEMVGDIDKNAILKSATASATAITESELQGALQKFGDEQDNDTFAGIVINSLLLPSFYAMTGFVDGTKTYAKEGNGEIMNGVVGFYRGGIPVILSDSNTYDSVKSECKSYIIKKGALGIKDKRGLLPEVERVASKKQNNVFADEMFACGLIQKDGVCIVRKTIA